MLDQSTIRPFAWSAEEHRRIARAVSEAPVNSVQKLRESQLLGKAELARRAGVSESTIDRVEAGHGCRMETKRKILFALGLTLQDGPKVFKKARSSQKVKNGRSH